MCIRDRAEAYGYINRALPDAELDAYVEGLATRIAKSVSYTHLDVYKRQVW